MRARVLPLAAASVFALAAWCVSVARAAAPASAPTPAASPASGEHSAGPTGAEILQELRQFRTFGTVLMVAAHPDDENRPLLAFLSKSQDLRTGYLSINRGDGGQNEIGPEFGEKLGVIRTQELLAGRRLDGARQFFTRAIDFGYSKSMEETLRIWDHAAVLGDVVRVIRTFRPDVIITVFAPVPQRGNHGHHNASAFLATEAFKLAGDPKAYPEQIAEGLQPWQPRRIVQNGGNGLTITGGGVNPATGETIAAIAARTSAQHKTQGVGARGGGGGANFSAGFTLLDGAPGAGLLDGVDTTWARVPDGGAEIAKLADNLIANFKPDDPAASVPAILALRAKLPTRRTATRIRPEDPVLLEKYALLDRILQHCLGLVLETTVSTAEVTHDDTINIHFRVSSRATIPISWQSPAAERPMPPVAVFNDSDRVMRFGSGRSFPKSGQLVAGQATEGEITERAELLAPAHPLTQPYWLREEPAAGIYRVSAKDAKLIGQPENPPLFVVWYSFRVGGQNLTLYDDVRASDGLGRPARSVAIISPVSLKFGSGVALFTPSAKKTVEVEVSAARANATGMLRLELPADWMATPAGQPFKLAASGDKARLAFTVTAPASAATGSILAVAEMADGTRFSNGRVDIVYDHIPPQILQPPARLRVTATDFATRGKNVGYLPGAGDATAEALAQLGYAVTVLTGADLVPEKLRGLDAVVIGVRAFNERTDFAASFPALLAWVEQGGTVIAQYNRPNGLRTQQLGPFPLSIQGQAPPLRVTDENAPVTFRLPGHPALNVPNKITAADFAGWVQERGAYFASSWDERYEAPLAMSDPGETQPDSSLLIAKYGKGYYVYTSLAFFRQLPAGVPGAYRLFANLVSLGK
jgi:LmbE family N-acetylglucosaminyl deacetylase